MCIRDSQYGDKRCATLILQKEAWPCAVDLVFNLIAFAGVKQVIICGDGKHALQSLMSLVGDILKTSGSEMQESQSTEAAEQPETTEEGVEMRKLTFLALWDDQRKDKLVGLVYGVPLRKEDGVLGRTELILEERAREGMAAEDLPAPAESEGVRAARRLLL